MPNSKFTSILLCAFVSTAALGVTACDKGGGGSKKGKSERLRWVNKPVSGTSENDGKLIKIPGISVDFYKPDVLYVYKSCVEPAHSPEGPDKEWIPVIRCTSTAGASDDSDSDDWESDDDDDDGGERVLTIYATDKGDMIINERTTASYQLQYEQAGYKVESINFFDEYLSKPGRRGIEVVAQTIDSSTGYPDREIRRFMFPKDDVVFIAHIDYDFGADRSGINSDWERILWNFHYAEDGPLFE